jgi:prepilin-type N-terminal cleavage/methylation domain-containing protein/prepilin-type processing-associated H-X9-DG protein
MNAIYKFTSGERLSKTVLNRKSRGAFTLIELLVVIVILGILAAILLPVLAKAKYRAQGITCVSNERQLILGFRMYADDNGDVMVHSGNGGPWRNGRPVWINGSVNFNGVGTAGWVNWWIGTSDAPGSLYLAGGPLWSYTGQQPALYRCPADKVMITASGAMPPGGFKPGQYPRVRSISMSQVFGAGDWQSDPRGAYKLYSLFTTIDLPSKTQVFMDEHPNSLNDAAFGWRISPDQAIVDVPAAYHNGRAGGFGFADGHGEIHKWISTEISPPVVPGFTGFIDGLRLPTTPEGKVDVAWMCDNNTVRQ